MYNFKQDEVGICDFNNVNSDSIRERSNNTGELGSISNCRITAQSNRPRHIFVDDDSDVVVGSIFFSVYESESDKRLTVIGIQRKIYFRRNVIISFIAIPRTQSFSLWLTDTYKSQRHISHFPFEPNW